MPSELMAEAFMKLMLDGAGATRPGRVGLFLHIDLDDLDGDVPDTAHTEANLDITDETLWALLGAGDGGDVTPMFNTNGMPLSYGRTRRLAPAMLRRALAHRDRRCGFGWCDAPALLTQAHHVHFWENGGLTDPENQKLGCKFHHHCIHDHGWVMSGTPPDVTITRPDGKPHTNDQQWRAGQRARHKADKTAILARLHRERRLLGSAA